VSAGVNGREGWWSEARACAIAEEMALRERIGTSSSWGRVKSAVATMAVFRPK
jgi:hypothetical protein